MPPLKAQLLLEESLSAYFPEMVFTDSGITVQLHRNTQLRTVTQKRPQVALSGMASSTVPTLSATTAVTAAVGALLGTTASSLAGPLAATYGLYRAWRWFRD